MIGSRGLAIGGVGIAAIPRERCKALAVILIKSLRKVTCAECVLCLVVFVKPLADMLWSALWLDVVLTAATLVAFVLLYSERFIRFGVSDVVALLLFVLVLGSWHGEPAAFSTMVKMSSAFLLYFVGRASLPYCENVVKAMRAASLICVVVCAALFAAGSGFKIWGMARTFCGPYFFKTDLAFAMTFAAALLLYWKDGPRWRYLAVAACALFVFESNARAYYIVFVVVFILWYAWRCSVRIGFGTIVGVAVGMVAILELLNVITSAGLLGSNFIGFQFDTFSDLFSGANTQGRNVIWAALLEMIRSAPLFNQLFGIDLISDLIMVDGSEYGSHSLYVGTLFNLGVVGLFLLLVLVAFALKSAAVVQGREKGDTMPYLALALALTFLISGISVHVLQYSANSWMPMLMFGLITSLAREPDLARGSGASDGFRHD